MSSIRDLIGDFIGQTVVDITQHDPEDWEQDGISFVQLMFAHGGYLKFYIDEMEAFVPEESTQT